MSLHDPISPLRALYVQKVLPAVYDDSLSYYEVLAKTQEKLNEVISDTNDVSALVLELQQAMYDFTHGGYTDSFEEYLDDWFAENSDEFVQRLVDEGIIPEVEDLQSDIDSMHASITALEVTDTELTSKKVPYPLVGATPSYGTSGQVLSTNADGTTDWQDPVIPSDAQAEQVITQWLNAHPEATTTVVDGSITPAKFQAGAPFKPNVPFAELQTTNLDDVTTPGAYPTRFSSGAGAYDSSWPEQVAGTLFVTTTESGTLTYQTYVTRTGNVYSRFKASTWSAWVNQAKSLFSSGTAFKPPVSYTLNQTLDLDTLTTAGAYPTLFSSGAGAYDSSWPEQVTGTLFVTQNESGTLIYQTYVTRTGNVYSRFKTSTWSAWDTTMNWVKSLFSSGTAFKPPVSYTQNQTLDLDTLTTPGAYPTLFSSGAGEYDSSWPEQVTGTLFVTVNNDNNLTYQTYVTRTGNVYSRFKASTWSAWVNQAKSLFSSGTAFKPPVSYTLNQTLDLDTLTTPGAYPTLFSSGAGAYDSSWPEQVTGTLFVTQNESGTLIYQTYVTRTGNVYSRFKTSTWSAWDSTYTRYVDEYEISILFVGNSLTADAISYLPWLLKTWYPYVKFRFYAWYMGGYTLANHLSAWQDNTPAQQFYYSENNRDWTIINNTVTMAQILSTYKFDIICMQEYFNNKTNYGSDDITTWNDCRDYLIDNYTGENGIEFVSMLHPPKRNNATNIYNLTKEGNALILQETIAQDMIPAGMAIYNAMLTSLSSLGDDGNLSNDGVHAQEGLPCLLQAMTVLLWIFDKLSVNKSIYGSDARMTATIYNTLTIPTPNLGTGLIQGTNAQNRLAQQTAIQSFKEGKKFVSDNLTPTGA